MFQIKTQWESVGDSVAKFRNRTIVHRTIAAAAPGDLYYYLAHQYDGDEYPAVGEPKDIEFILHEGEATKQGKFNGIYTIDTLPPGSHIPPPVPNDAFFLVIPTWPPRNYRAPQYGRAGRTVVIGEVIQSSQYCRTGRREMIDETPCIEVVSMDGADRIWIAEGKDLCIMRRELFDLDPLHLVLRLVTKRIAEVGPGLWLPVEFSLTQFAAQPSNEELLPIRTASTQIVGWRIGSDVPTDMFLPKIAPGSLVGNVKNECRQSLPGGIGHLDDITAYLHDAIGLPQPRRIDGGNSNRVGLAAGGLAGGFLVGLLLLSRRRPGQSSIGNPRRTRSVG